MPQVNPPSTRLRGKLATDEFQGTIEGEIINYDLEMETMDAAAMADAVDHHLEKPRRKRQAQAVK